MNTFNRKLHMGSNSLSLSPFIQYNFSDVSTPPVFYTFQTIDSAGLQVDVTVTSFVGAGTFVLAQSIGDTTSGLQIVATGGTPNALPDPTVTTVQEWNGLTYCNHGIALCSNSLDITYVSGSYVNGDSLVYSYISEAVDLQTLVIALWINPSITHTTTITGNVTTKPDNTIPTWVSNTTRTTII